MRKVLYRSIRFIVTESDLFSLKPTQSHKEVWVCCTFVLAISKVAFIPNRSIWVYGDSRQPMDDMEADAESNV